MWSQFTAALRATPALLALGALSCSTPSAPDAAAPRSLPDAHVVEFSAARSIVTRDGQYRIQWKPTGNGIPINEGFEVEALVTRNDDVGAPVTGAQLAMTCYMPDHGHGMLREPKSEELGDGRYLVRGFLLHMGGYWTVAATVVENGVASTADDELNL